MAINVSIALNKGFRCITLMDSGYVVKKDFGKYEVKNIYSDIIGVTKQAILLVRSYINSGNCKDDEFVFESSNSIFVGWFDKLYAKDIYQNEFTELLTLLNSLPIRYRIVHNEKPLASQYLKTFNEQDLKPKLSGLDLSVEED